MVTVSCPQCGALLEALTETRFYRCPYCTSSFVVEEGTGIPRYTFAHPRDDRHAWSSLTGHLAAAGFSEEYRQISCDFITHPFWLFTLANGGRRLLPAAPLEREELAGLGLPGGDLEYLREETGFADPTIHASEASILLGPDAVLRSLVYLPLYLLTFEADGESRQATVSAVDARVYVAGTLQPRWEHPSRRHILMVGTFAAILLLEGLLVRNLLWRMGVFALTLSVTYPVCRLLLREEL